MNPISASNTAPALVQTTGTLPERTSASSSVNSASSAPAPVVEARPTSDVSRESLEVAAKQIDSFVKTMGRSLSFSVDDSTGRAVMRVVDPETKEVIRQLPPEETLKIAKSLEYLSSVLVRQKA